MYKTKKVTKIELNLNAILCVCILINLNNDKNALTEGFTCESNSIIT